jgi:hypothetical protein
LPILREIYFFFYGLFVFSGPIAWRLRNGHRDRDSSSRGDECRLHSLSMGVFLFCRSRFVVVLIEAHIEEDLVLSLWAFA